MNVAEPGKNREQSAKAIGAAESDQQIDPKLIESQLGKILRSQEFARSARMARFLSHIVQSRLEGRSEFGKERSIGVEVFDRPTDWDPKIDTIVRSEARRLRSKLEQYYATSQGDVLRFTLPKGGYYPNFEKIAKSAPALEAETNPKIWEPPVALQSTATAANISGKHRISFAVLSLIALAVLSIAAFTWLVLRLPPPQQKAEAFEVVSFANEIGTEVNPAIAPDGQSIAYAWDGNNGNFDIYIKRASGGPNTRPRRVTQTAAAEFCPAWSPDGRTLAFLRFDGQSSALILLNLITGEERLLRVVSQNAAGWAGENSPFIDIGPSWTPDGRFIVFSDTTTKADRQDNSASALYLVSVADGTATPILESPRGLKNFFPRVAPDGKRLAFVRYTSHGVSDLYVCNLDGSNIQRLTEDGREITGLAWSSNNASLYFTSWHNGSSRIWQIGRSSGSRAEPLPDASSAEGIAVSADGKWIAYAYLIENWNIWRMPLSESGPSIGLGKPQRFIASTGRNHGPSFSPDGTKLAFISDRSGSWQIWLADPDGGNVRQISQSDGNFLGSINWTPDSKVIAFDARPTGNSNIYMLDVPTGGIPRPLGANRFEERMPSFSADGRSIYFNSNRDGTTAIWKADLQKGTRSRVGLDGSFKSLETPSGQLLLYNGFRSVYTADADGSRVQLLPDIHPMPNINWIPTAKALYYTEESDNGEIAFKAYREGTSTLLLRVPGHLVQNTSNLAISPDRRWLLYAQQDQSTSDIVIRRLRPNGHR